MTNVFICYEPPLSSAENICKNLEEAGISCHCTTRGTDRPSVLDESAAIAECRAFILLLNAAASRSADVLRQTEAAISRANAGEDILILPLQVSEEKMEQALMQLVARLDWTDGVSRPLSEAENEITEKVKTLFPDAVPGSIQHKEILFKPDTAAPADNAPEKAPDTAPRKRSVKTAVLAAVLVVIAGAMLMHMINRLKDISNMYNNTSYTKSEVQKRFEELPPLTDEQKAQGIERWISGNTIFTGHKVEGLIEGDGEGIYLKGDTYKGPYVHGKCEGYGTLTFPNGDVYEGEWANDKYNGHGVMTFASGSKYDGEWKDDKKCGHGTYIYYSDGKYIGTYEGEWKDGEWNGYGTLTEDDGTVRKGEYKDGLLNGHAEIATADGDTFSGEYKDGKPNGRGKVTYKDGTVYDGEWSNGEECGYGIKTFPDGTVYDGEWQDGMPCGHGIAKHDGYTLETEWKADGTVYGHAVFIDENGDRYEGECSTDGYKITITQADGTIKTIE